MSQRILVADDNATNRRLLAAIFSAEGFEVDLAEGGEEALARAAAAAPAAVLLDLRMPGLSGLETLGRLKRVVPDVPVIILTSHGEVAAAVEATRLGAFDFLIRPIQNDELVLKVKRALERRELEAEVAGLRRQVEAGTALAGLVGPSAGLRRVVELVEQVAPSSLTVLVQGETGTGKELVARAVHQRSARSGGPFIAIDCGAIPENLLESELFGHEKGAFTGADRRKQGHFELARGGTLFLDETANLPAPIQAKLLRVLQERQLVPLGGGRPQPLDVRFIAATNEPLDAQVAAGRFRADLYYRLAEFVIAVPPLRERRDDILPLARRFQAEASVELRRPACRLAEGVAELLCDHAWPGNVRELRNVIRQAVLQAAGPSIEAEDLRPLLGRRGARSSAVTSIEVALGRPLKQIAEAAAAAAERQAILEALRATRGNKSQAARLLKVDYKTLHLKMKKLGLPARE